MARKKRQPTPRRGAAQIAGGYAETSRVGKAKKGMPGSRTLTGGTNVPRAVKRTSKRKKK